MQVQLDILINTQWCVQIKSKNGSYYNTGATFKTSMSPHRTGFTRSYPHRVIIKKISSNALVPTKTWLPNRVYIFNTTGSPTLCSSPTWFINISNSQSGNIKLLIIPKQEIINPQLSIFKIRSNIKI